MQNNTDPSTNRQINRQMYNNLQITLKLNMNTEIIIRKRFAF